MLLIRGNGSQWVKHHGPDRVGGPRVGPAVLVDDPAVELEGPADEELGAVRPVEAMESIDGRGAATEGSGQRGAVGGPVALGVDLASLVGAIKEAGVLDQIHGVEAMDGMEAGGALVGGVDGVVDMKV